MKDDYGDHKPISSDHINGIIYEKDNTSRIGDRMFGEAVRTCDFLAKYHHNQKNLKILAERYTNMFTFQ